MTHHHSLQTYPTQEYVVPRSGQHVNHPGYKGAHKLSLTNTDEGSKLGLLALISVDRNRVWGGG